MCFTVSTCALKIYSLLDPCILHCLMHSHKVSLWPILSPASVSTEIAALLWEFTVTSHLASMFVASVVLPIIALFHLQRSRRAAVFNYSN